MCADRHRFGRLIESFENDFVEARDRFPTRVTDGYQLLTNYTNDPRLEGQCEVGGGEIAFKTLTEKETEKGQEQGPRYVSSMSDEGALR